jgi:hypothetical protein
MILWSILLIATTILQCIQQTVFFIHPFFFHLMLDLLLSWSWKWFRVWLDSAFLTSTGFETSLFISPQYRQEIIQYLGCECRHAWTSGALEKSLRESRMQGKLNTSRDSRAH